MCAYLLLLFFLSPCLPQLSSFCLNFWHAFHSLCLSPLCFICFRSLFKIRSLFIFIVFFFFFWELCFIWQEFLRLQAQEAASQVILREQLWGRWPAYIEVLQQRAGGLNIRGLLLVKENQISQVKEFSTSLCMGRWESLGSPKSFLWYAPQLFGASILFRSYFGSPRKVPIPFVRGLLSHSLESSSWDTQPKAELLCWAIFNQLPEIRL